MRELQKYWCPIIILIIAILLRTWAIEIKPPHFDEGINGWFTDQMKTTGYYNYNPENFHGPFYFYLVYASQALFGRELWALRLPAILGSILGIVLLLKSSQLFGRVAAYTAALMLAVSPAAVFYGRYSIHESWFTAFIILTVLGLIGLWKTGTDKYLAWVIFGIAGMVANKETYIIHLGCIGLAYVTMLMYNRIFQPTEATWAKQHWSRKRAIGYLLGAVVFTLLIYSGGLLNIHGIVELGKGLITWTQTGTAHSGHSKPFFYWISLMWRYELITLIGVLCCFRFLFKSDAKLRFLTIYGAGVLLAYSIIAYKTPWCILTIQWPFFLLLGAVISELCNKTKNHKIALLVVVCVGILLPSLSVGLPLNFENYDDDTEPYVYVQTIREINIATTPIIAAAKKDATKYSVRGAIILSSYYPLPWIFGDFQNIAYSADNKIIGNIDFVITEKAKAAEIEKQLSGSYYSSDFRLRGAQDMCRVYLKADTYKEHILKTNFYDLKSYTRTGN